MAIDITIKQRLFGRKTMPLEVILGDHLSYGCYSYDHLYPGELGESEFIAYNPQSIGRGFSVVWNPNEKRAIDLRLPLPSTEAELRDFYDAIERMVTYWNAGLVVDGTRTRLSDFMAGFSQMVSFNEKTIRQIAESVMDQSYNTLALYSAMWPLTIGKQEATLFLQSPANYAAWLHEKQSMDVHFVAPHFYEGEDGIFARYTLTDNIPALLPLHPTVPIGMVDPSAGTALECSDWRIILALESEEECLCEMEYEKFLHLIPENKKSDYDANHFLLAAMNENELRDLSTHA